MPSKKLLVADDSLTIQKVIRLALSNEGYEIQAVSDGNDAIQQVALFRPDIILIDVSLPGKSAFEVKREINQHEDLEEVRFVLMSSAFEKVDETQTEEVKFHGRLTKPFDPAHLRQVLTEVLAQVTAKRMEKTSILTKPLQETAPPPPISESENYSNWESTLTPPELPPILPPSPPESVQELWDSPEEANFNIDSSEFLSPSGFPPPMEGSGIADASPMVTPPPLPNPTPSIPIDIPTPQKTSTEPETDIRELTESTMKMTGLDDFQWSVKEPILKPLANMLDSGESSFPIDSSEHNELPDPPTQISPPPPFHFEDSEFAKPIGGTNLSEMIEVSDLYQETPSPSGTLIQPKTLSPDDFSPLTAEHIEALVARQVEATLERLARKLLPEVAEKLIKQEIHRILSE